ncbi:MAG: hypothetical protein ACLQVX_20135 [Limisphaerales bacterium]
MDDITKEFLVESYENLDQMERDLVKLEKDPHSKETLGRHHNSLRSLRDCSLCTQETKDMITQQKANTQLVSQISTLSNLILAHLPLD